MECGIVVQCGGCENEMGMEVEKISRRRRVEFSAFDSYIEIPPRC